jgi:taurine transport system substrate-binding protein
MRISARIRTTTRPGRRTPRRSPTNGAKVEDIFDEVDGAYYPLADEQASPALLGKGTANAIAATAAFLKEQKKVDALLPSYSESITAEFVKAAANPMQ